MKKCMLPAQLALLLAPMLAAAQTSRIDQVLVYPGGATVDRVAAVKAGTRELRLSCLGARFDPESLQIKGEGVAIGEVTVQTQPRAALPECANSALELRVRELEDSQAGLNAEIQAHELALGYLKRYGEGDTRSSTAPIAGTAEILRKSGLDSLQKQHALQRKKEELERALAPLRAELDRQQQANAQLRTVTIRLSARADTELRLSYRTPFAGWEPVYRALLDTDSGKVLLERHAQVAQTSGEDWSNVKLRLSTAQPRQATGITPPRPWTLDILPPVVNTPTLSIPPVAAMAAPMAEQRVSVSGSRVQQAEVSFDVSVFQGEFATEFEVPGRSSVNADNQRIALSLGSTALDARLLARAQPLQEAAAYLVAESKRPAGVWPAGKLQLFRDGAFMGQGRLQFGSEELIDLSFGRDELVRISADPEARNAGSAGFIGSRAEQKRGHVYRIENLHKKAFTVQLLEPSPVARHEDIRVQAQFDPKPTEDSWRKQPGVVAWLLDLAPGQQQKLTADYVISYPKDARINGLR